MAKDEFHLLLDLNRVFVNRISDDVVNILLKMKDKSYLLSGDDSGLKNAWEEICIQRQTDYSFHWPIYEELIENIIQLEFEKQPEAIQKLISYIGSLEDDDFEVENPIGINTEAAISELKDEILERAGFYSNKNIDRFLDK